ncbi:MAG: hypothetical protein COV44_06540 [Deltaproteobacteria bacterium CG11_big_fil_rev_8_21_14_0_20_45_16]|nr:MAG: hypothetical protein COV44_06540 [Deltaproteobacteria bacterium CG11_big_fil_rev_8_21_14_0_20_45_16]
MDDPNEFGGQSSVETLRLLMQFRKLDAKAVMGLSADESKLYTDLSARLGKLIDPKSQKVIQRRKNLRISTNIEVNLKSGKDFEKVYIKNISGGGVYVATKSLHPIGSLVSLNIHIADQKKVIDVQGCVSWLNPQGVDQLPPGMGVRFIDLTPAQEELIRSLVRNRLEEELGKKKD